MLAATNSKVLWFATRSTGMVSLVLLTLSVAFGIAEFGRLAGPRWPRFVVAALHRNIALLATAFLGVHILTAVADSFAPIRVVDLFVPFVATYRPIWLGLGTIAFDLLLAVIVTSLLRERLGHRAWRAVHWASYAAWPTALVHALGTGSDTRARWAVVVNVTCLAIVLVAVLTRVGWTATASAGRRAVATLGSLTIAVGVTTWMVLEPMRGGWARKAGTPSALLASAAGSTSNAVVPVPIPFTSATRGSIRRTTSNSSGLTTVTIKSVLPAIGNAPLRVVIEGTPLPGGGVSMQRGRVTFGVPGAPGLYRGSVVGLDGTTVVASLTSSAGAPVILSMEFSIPPDSHAVGGTVTGRYGSSVR